MTDMQSRLKSIQKTATEIRERLMPKFPDPPPPVRPSDVENLAYAVDYLAKIVEMHLRTGET